MSLFSNKRKNNKVLPAATMVLVLIVGIVLAAILPGVVENHNQRRMLMSLNTSAAQQVTDVNRQVVRLQAQLRTALKAASLADVFRLHEPSQLRAVADQLRTSIPGAAEVLLIPAGEGADALRFSQLDRIHQMERTGVALPEAFQRDGHWLIDLLFPVRAEADSLLGTVLVVLNADVLSPGLPESAASTVVVLQQKFPQIKEMEFLRSAGQLEQQFRSDVYPLPDVPHWQIVVFPTDQLLNDTVISPWWLYAAQSIIAVLCLLAILRCYRTLKNDEATHDAAARDTPIQIKGAKRIDKYTDAPMVNTGSVALDQDSAGNPLFLGTDVLDMDDDPDFKPVVRATASQQNTVLADRPASVRAGELYDVNATVFRDYDIRGNAEQYLSDDLARRVGRAFGSECIEQGYSEVVLAGDGRLSTPRLKAAVMEGLLASGCDVLDAGLVPTPLLYFAASTHATARCGLMVTASHNPAGDNGFKMVIAGRSLASEQIQRLRERVQHGDFREGEGRTADYDVVSSYVEHITTDIVLAGSYRVVVDAGNGIAGAVAPGLFEELGCEVIPLYCDVDGAFPHHAPDPSVLENLADLVARVQEENADIGVALDGDGDRITVVTATGKIVLPDRLLMLFAKDIASRNPGADIVFDVKSTRHLNSLISSYGGRPVMWKSGHAHIKNKMLESDALLGGELSGHIFFKERWFGFDDGMYSAARLLEIMSIRDQDLDGILAAFPESAATPEIRVPIDEERKFAVVRRLVERGEWGSGKVTTLDGVRVDFAKGWGLVRASNTSAALTLRFEADDEETLNTLKQVFRQQLLQVDGELMLPF